VIHGGVADYLNFQVDQHTLNVLAYDGVALSHVETEQNVLMAPGNRLDVLIKAGAPGTYPIRRLSYDQGFGPSPELEIATLVVEGEPMQMGLPTVLPTPYAQIEDSEITGTRSLTFDTLPAGGVQPIANFAINEQQYDPNRVDQLVELGAVEEWTVTNTSFEDHPIHVHVNHFQVMQIGDRVLPVPRWMDTVSIPPFSSVRFRTRFEDFTGRFVLHCHIVLHECLGMMEVVDVVPPGMTREERQGRVIASRRVLERANLRAMPKRDAEYCLTPKPYRRLRWGDPSPT
jgi:FtsP/CotA-like multicopper oxidase with cupredoxin domain